MTPTKHLHVGSPWSFEGRFGERFGAISPGEPLPNGYYMRNRDQRLRALELRVGAPVTLTTWDRHNVGPAKSTDVATLVRVYAAPEDWEASVLRSPYWLTVRGGTVVGVSELYLP